MPRVVPEAISSLPHRAWSGLLQLANRTEQLNAQPFDPATEVHTPRDRWGIVHYGVMVPGLPAPLRFLDAIVVLGSSTAPIFDNRSLVTTTPEDSAWVMTGSGLVKDSFRPFSIETECDLAPDGSDLRFGSALTVRRRPEAISVAVENPAGGGVLELRPTTAVSHFVHLPGVYDHWSLLCEYTGRFDVDGESVETSGLCTYEYARAVNVPLPMRFFTYQIINVDDRVQVLMVEVLAPGRVPVQRSVYVRSTDGANAVHTQGYEHTVHEYADEPLVTPDGHRMRMPRRFTWSVSTDAGEIRIDGTCNDDFVYGLAAGFAGSYDYTGEFQGRDVSGTGYIEWIDR